MASGSLLPGSSLPTEPELSALYGMSRSAIREAIHTLAANGFVLVRQGSGTRVADREHWNELDPDYVSIAHGAAIYEHLIEARETLEPSIAAKAAERATPQELERLSAIVVRMREIGTSDAQAHADIDTEFHQTIAQASANPILLAMHSSLIQLGRRSRARLAAVPGGVGRAIEWHEHIVEAIAAHDPDAAAAAMRLHLRQVRGEQEALARLENGDR